MIDTRRCRIPHARELSLDRYEWLEYLDLAATGRGRVNITREVCSCFEREFFHADCFVCVDVYWVLVLSLSLQWAGICHLKCEMLQCDFVVALYRRHWV